MSTPYSKIKNKILKRGLQEKEYLIYFKNIGGAHVMT